MKESILSSFIKYLKSLICSFKEHPAPLIKKEDESKTPSPSRRPKRGKGSKLDLHRGEIVASLDNGKTKASIARKYGVSSVNLHHWLKRRKIKISKKQ